MNNPPFMTNWKTYLEDTFGQVFKWTLPEEEKHISASQDYLRIGIALLANFSYVTIFDTKQMLEKIFKQERYIVATSLNEQDRISPFSVISSSWCQPVHKTSRKLNAFSNFSGMFWLTIAISHLTNFNWNDFNKIFFFFANIQPPKRDHK